MLRRSFVLPVFILTVMLGLLASGCGDSNVQTVDKQNASAQTAQSATEQPMHENSPAMKGGSAGAAGIMWMVPDQWVSGPDRPMRVATYNIGEADNAPECAIYYFGPGQGGDVDANIQRWIGQFEQPDGSKSSDKATVGKREVNGLQVTTIDLTGTYNASMGGPMSGQKQAMPGYRMLGAIIDAPKGPVFFKLTGPQELVGGAESDFSQMVESVKKTGSV